MGTMTIPGIDADQIMYGQDNTLSAVEAIGGYRLRLTYRDGTSYELNMTPIMEKGVMSQLNEEAVFSQVRLACEGAAIEFPHQIDFCADSLRLDCELQKAGYPNPWDLDL